MGVCRRLARAAALCVAGLAPLACTGEPPLEPFEVEAEVPLPPEVLPPSATGVGESFSFDGKLTPDFQHVVVRVVIDDSDQMGVMDLDGSNFHCLTCDAYETATALEPFPDEQRALVNLGGGGIGDIQLSVLECSPGLYDCQSWEALPLRFPIPGILDGAQNRGAQLHPDGEHLKWSEVQLTEGEIMTLGRLERNDAEGRYDVVPLVVLNPAYDLDSGQQGFVDGGRYYELGEWTDGGRAIKYGTTTTAANYDIWELDLATGARRQVTTDLDYNELYDVSPDGRRLAYSSARGLDRMDVFSQLVRPPYIEMVSFPQIGRVGLWNNRRCMNERWLMDRAGQRGTYAGQPIVTEDGWTIRAWSWFPDGTRALVAEYRLPTEPEPVDPYARVRMRILRFPARVPTTPLPAVGLSDLDLSWAVPYGAYQGMASQQVAGQVVPGRVSGTATLDFSGDFASGAWTVTYDHYSDDGRSTLDGTESIDTLVQLISSTWSADLTSEGERQGYLEGSLRVSGPGSFTGSVASEVNGVAFDEVPVQADCPGVHVPPLVVEHAAAFELGARWVLLLVDVRAEVPEDPTHRPVQQAKVEVAGRSALTNEAGWAALLVRRSRAAKLEIEASAGGFLPVTAEVDLRR